MERWLKWLIAAACCAVIALAAVYLYGEITRKMEADAFASKRETCTENLSRFYGDRVNSGLANQVENCVVLGYLSKDEVYAKLHPTF